MSKKKILLYLGRRQFHHSRFSLIQLKILGIVVFVTLHENKLINSHRHYIKILPRCTVWEQKDKNLTNDWMSSKLTNLEVLASTYAVFLIAWSSFSFDNLTVKVEVSISILETGSTMPLRFLKCFCGNVSRSVSQIHTSIFKRKLWGVAFSVENIEMKLFRY